MVNALSLVLATGLITTKPAAVFFAVGDEFIHHLIGFMLSMPILILIAAICPEGAMSTVYALVTSIQSAGQDASSAISSGKPRSCSNPAH